MCAVINPVFWYICIDMATSSEIRNRVIDSLMSIDNQEYLKALEKMIKSSNIEHSKVPLTEEQKIMLTMSDKDILNGKFIDQQTLNERELGWLTKK
jgi:hypothetical protein